MHQPREYQPRDRLDSEIENMRMLMVKMSHKRHKEKILMNIYISRAKRQSNNMRHITKKYSRSKASGELQQKVWKPGEPRMPKTKQHDEMDDQLRHKVWDPGILKMEGYDQEFIFPSS